MPAVPPSTPPLFDLACARCRSPYPDHGLPPNCTFCDGLWTYGERLAWAPPSDEPGLRAWAGALGLGPDELPERTIGRAPVRLGGVLAARDGSAPTGSFKERGAEVLLAACVRRGIGDVFLDSSGNAGIAVARAAAERGARCTVLVPESTAAGKLSLLEDTGARIEVVPGDRQATHRAARSRLSAGRGGTYASHIVQPAFHAGVATLAWDLERHLRRGRGSIERVLLPVGQGSLLLGTALGLERLVAAGRLPRLPRFHAVQLAGYAALAPEGPGEHPADRAPRAAGIAVPDPPRRTELVAWIERTGGDVTVVTDDEIAGAREELRQEGLPTDATGAAAWALLRDRPELAGAGTVVVLTSVEESG